MAVARALRVAAAARARRRALRARRSRPGPALTAQLPMYALIAFGCYSLSVIGWRVLTFPEARQAAEELKEVASFPRLGSSDRRSNAREHGRSFRPKVLCSLLQTWTNSIERGVSRFYREAPSDWADSSSRLSSSSPKSTMNISASFKKTQSLPSDRSTSPSSPVKMLADALDSSRIVPDQSNLSSPLRHPSTDTAPSVDGTR